MPEPMTTEQRRDFLTAGTRSAVLATTRADGRPHAVPVWYAMDGDDLLVNTGADTVKGRDLARDPRVAVVVHDDRPPYAFVMVEGVAELISDPEALKAGSAVIGRHYLDAEAAAAWVEYAASPGKVLVRVRPTNVVAIDRVGG
jgi:PPOX class probable F420-dependent enzyme